MKLKKRMLGTGEFLTQKAGKVGLSAELYHIEGAVRFAAPLAWKSIRQPQFSCHPDKFRNGISEHLVHHLAAMNLHRRFAGA